MHGSSSAACHWRRSRLHTSRRERPAWVLGTWTRDVGIAGESRSWRPILSSVSLRTIMMETADTYKRDCDCKYSKLYGRDGCSKRHGGGCCAPNGIVAFDEVGFVELIRSRRNQCDERNSIERSDGRESLGLRKGYVGGFIGIQAICERFRAFERSNRCGHREGIMSQRPPS
jgi:hypothetical protein